MRKRVLLTAAGALALMVGLASPALATHGQVVQTTDGTLTVTNLPKTVWKNAGLKVVTSVRDAGDPEVCASANPPADGSCTVPPKAAMARIDFDSKLRFNPNAIPKCNPQAVSGKSTQEARAACQNSMVGQGLAMARGGQVGGPTSPIPVPAVVSAFNSTAANQLILHVDLGALGTLNLIGTLVNSPRAGFGKRLNVPVPSTPAILTRFETTVQRGRYVQARCPASPIRFHGLFEYSDRGTHIPGGEPIYPATAEGSSAVPCTKQVQPFLRRCIARANRAFNRKVRRAKRRLSGRARARAIARAKKQRRVARKRCRRLHA